MARREAGLFEHGSQSRAYPSLGLVLAVLVIGIHFGRIYDPTQPLATDSRYYTHFAIEIARGAVPHLDFFGNKTQAAALLAAPQVVVGSWLGFDAIEAIRFGSLLVVALGGLLLYCLHRMFAGGQEVAAWLGLLPYLGFAYIGTLPATGSVPKLMMAVAATGAALLVARGRWFAAGLVSAMAPLDWQIGAFACLGVFAAACFDARPARALTRSALAVAGVGLGFLLYFVLVGALDVMLAQTIGASFARGVEAGGPLFKFAAIYNRLAMNASGEQWLVGIGLVGFFLYPYWFALERFTAVRKPMLVMAVYHYGVVAFSLIDFQGSGDTMLLLHSLAFFAGVALVSAWLLAMRSPTLAGSRPWAGIVAVGLTLALTRPIVMEPPRVETPDSPLGVSLEDQRTFARRLAPLVQDRSLLVLGPTEMLVLGDFEHETIFHFWNDATRYEYARTRNVGHGNLLAELVAEVAPGVIVASRDLSFPPDIPYRGVDLGRPGGYAVRVFVRIEGETEGRS